MTDRQQLFVDAYCGAARGNAAEAARLAGYAPERARQEGHRLKSEPEVWAAIEVRLTEETLSAKEILARLTEIANVDLADFITISKRGAMKIDLAKAQKAGRTHLVKKLSRGKFGWGIELHDAMGALDRLARVLRLYSAERTLDEEGGDDPFRHLTDEELDRKSLKLKREKLRRLYQAAPELYAEQQLNVIWWNKQIEVARALLKHHRVFVKASHSVGKSFLAGGLVNWFFDVFRPGICITTAPNAQQVKDILWKEIRMQRPYVQHRVLQPKAPRMETSPEHFAVGYTARDSNAFQGRHEEFVLIIFDEGTGVEGPFWESSEGMMTGPNCYWLVILNPTDTSSRAYEESLNTEKWKVIEISALDHPNIAADLAGQPAPFPKAVRLSWIEGRLKEWCTRIQSGDAGASDFEFPKGSGRWWRPGPLFESRVLGLWPTQGSTSVWTEALWLASMRPQVINPQDDLEIGCDKARFGDDFTSFVVRRGPCALHHETHNGWNNLQIAGLLKQLCHKFSLDGENPRKVICRVDDLQGGVIDLAWVDQRLDGVMTPGGYTFIDVNSSSVAAQPEDYPNKRSELWFATVERANESRLDLSRLSEESLKLLRRQVMAPTWKVDAQGRRVVEPKADTKKRIGRSPDDADALNLAYDGSGKWSDMLIEEDQMGTFEPESLKRSRLW